MKAVETIMGVGHYYYEAVPIRTINYAVAHTFYTQYYQLVCSHFKATFVLFLQFEQTYL